jgi:hypothetical protein
VDHFLETGVNTPRTLYLDLKSLVTVLLNGKIMKNSLKETNLFTVFSISSDLANIRSSYLETPTQKK